MIKKTKMFQWLKQVCKQIIIYHKHHFKNLIYSKINLLSNKRYIKNVIPLSKITLDKKRDMVKSSSAKTLSKENKLKQNVNNNIID